MNVARAEGLSLMRQIVIEKGMISDYRELAHLHYVPGDPAVVAGVWRAVWRGHNCELKIDNWQLAIEERLVAVGVLAWPTPACLARERALGISGPRYGEKLRFINEHVRTIARVIVHPQFRGLGVASK